MPPCYIYDEIINWLVISNIKMIAAALDQDFNEYPSGSLISVNKPVLANNTVQQRGGFGRNWQMIARIWARKRRLNEMEAGNAFASPISQCFVVRNERICQGQTIMTFTDLLAVSKLNCVDMKPP